MFDRFANTPLHFSTEYECLIYFSKVAFSREAIATNHATVCVNNVPVIRQNLQKHLGLFLDSEPNFFDYISEKIKKTTEGINVIRKTNFSLSRSSLLTIYK